MNNWDSYYLPIPYEFQPFFARLTSSTTTLLDRLDLLPKQRSLLEKLNFVLSRLPVLTVDVDFVVILCKSGGFHEFSLFPWNTCILEINNSFIRATNSYYGPSTHGNPMASLQEAFYCKNEGYWHREDEDGFVSLTVFKNWVERWESFCQDHSNSLTIHNLDEVFDWHQFHDDSAWEKMPSVFVE